MGKYSSSNYFRKKTKHFLEIGVFCGVTSRNVCETLNFIHHGNFSYLGFDLFGEKSNEAFNEVEPEYIKSQKFSNPLKTFLLQHILKKIKFKRKYRKIFK